MNRRSFLKVLAASVLLPLSRAFAGLPNQYIYLVVRTDIAGWAAQALKTKVRQILNDPEDLDFARLGHWRLVANHSVKFRVLSLDRLRPNGSLAPIPWTKEQAETWVGNNLGAEAAKVWVKKGSDERVLLAEGIEPEPVPPDA